MSYTIHAELRTLLGRRAKRVHLAGKLPGILYGSGIASQPIQIGLSEFRTIYRQAGTSSLIDVVLNDGAPVKTLIQDVQIHPLTMEPYHVDFHHINMDEEMTVEIPLRCVGESKAVKELAGTLIHPIQFVHVKCLPANLPHDIEIDLSALQNFEDVITVESLRVPAGVTILDDAHITIATVAPPLTEEQIKKLEETASVDVSAIKTEAEEKRAAEAAEQAKEVQAEGASDRA